MTSYIVEVLCRSERDAEELAEMVKQARAKRATRERQLLNGTLEVEEVRVVKHESPAIMRRMGDVGL